MPQASKIDEGGSKQKRRRMRNRKMQFCALTSFAWSWAGSVRFSPFVLFYKGDLCSKPQKLLKFLGR